MLSASLANATRGRLLRRIIWWVSVVVYTLVLPWVILVFNTINRYFSSEITASVSHIIMIILGVFYTVISVRKKKATQCLIILGIGALIVLSIMKFETNPNKYIHIPEYVLMTWLLYQALAIDYKGSGIFLLIFTCAALLGIVDEILQGIHPQRTYGWKDMIIDTASGFIGVLMLMGHKKNLSPDDWTWIRQMRQFKGFLAAMLFGAATAVPMCTYLFDVQDQGTFGSAYPGWLLGANGLFLTTSGLAFVFHWLGRQRSDRFIAKTEPDTPGSHTTALLWVMCPLAILICMQGLVMWTAVAVINFK
jgi:VanZ family protein